MRVSGSLRVNGGLEGRSIKTGRCVPEICKELFLYNIIFTPNPASEI